MLSYMPRVLEIYMQGPLLPMPGNHMLPVDNNGIIGNNPRNDITDNSHFISFYN